MIERPGADHNLVPMPGDLDGDALKTFDYVVANPPFSDKRWSTGLDAEHDAYQRFQPYGVPPAKQGDYCAPQISIRDEMIPPRDLHRTMG